MKCTEKGCNKTDIHYKKLGLCTKHYMKWYRRTHREQIRPVSQARYLRNREKYLKIYAEYQRKHPYKTKSKEANRKNNIRARTFQIYGAPPKGYERHHLNYDSPHNFILLLREEHRKLHWKKNDKPSADLQEKTK